jgi:hypothetical protein
VSTATTTDLSVEDLEESLGGIPCQGLSHHEGKYGHDPDLPAAWLLICPHCGPGVMQCQPRVNAMRQIGWIQCMRCKETIEYERWGKVQL